MVLCVCTVRVSGDVTRRMNHTRGTEREDEGLHGFLRGREPVSPREGRSRTSRPEFLATSPFPALTSELGTSLRKLEEWDVMGIMRKERWQGRSSLTALLLATQVSKYRADRHFHLPESLLGAIYDYSRRKYLSYPLL